MTRDKPASKLDMVQLAQDIELAPDAYQWERARRLGVAERTIGYGLQRLKVSYKKKRSNIPKQMSRHVATFKTR